MRPRRTRRLLALAAFGALLAAPFVGAGVAKAAPDVCSALAASPTVGTVEDLVLAYVAEGHTPYRSGELIAYAVFDGCPRYAPVLQRFIAAWAPEASMVGGGIGGRLT